VTWKEAPRRAPSSTHRRRRLLIDQRRRHHSDTLAVATCDAVCSGRGHNGRPLSLAYRWVPGTQGGVREPDPAAGARRPASLTGSALPCAPATTARTEEAYVAWIRRYIFFHGKRHPVDLGASEVTSFLTSLAVDGHVAASTQNQALGALLYLYRDVLEVDLPWLDVIVRAKRPERLPVVLTREEVRAVLQRLSGVPRLMASLLNGAGLRVLECCQLQFRTSTSAPTSSLFDAERATRTGSRCCRPSSRPLGLPPRNRPCSASGPPRGRRRLGRAAHRSAQKHPNAGREWAWQ
jgi:hypothetical protein